MTNSKIRLPEDIYSYEKQAFDSIPIDHPHYGEIRNLLIDQVNDELHDYETITVAH